MIRAFSMRSATREPNGLQRFRIVCSFPDAEARKNSFEQILRRKGSDDRA